MLKNFSLSGSISIVKNCKKGFFFCFVCRMIVSCLGGLVFHSFGYYLILLWMSISIGFFMVYLQLYSWSQIFFFLE